MAERAAAIHPSACREYDVRGTVPETLDEAAAYAVGRGFASRVRRAGGSRVAVGRDGRLSSPALEAALVEGLCESGVDVVRLGLGPTPMVYFAEATLGVDGAVQVTGSHNPRDDNGFKMVLHHRPFFGEDVQDLARMARTRDWTIGQGRVSEHAILDTYVDRLMAGYAGGAYRIGWDCGSGAAGPVIEKLVQRLPGEHHTLFTDVDGHFPHHHPDPTVESNLDALKRLVTEKSLDFGFAFDGDGDRIGAIDGLGRVIWGDQILMLLAGPALAEHPGAPIVADVKASQALFDHITTLGGQPVMWKTGHSLMKTKMAETDAPLGGEMSGHMFFAGEWYGFDDAHYAAIRLIRAAHLAGRSMTELRGAMPVMVDIPETRIVISESDKFAIVDRVAAALVRDGAQVNDTDGVRVRTADGWWLLRASNTQAALTVRAEAGDAAGLERVLAELDHYLAMEGVRR
ncbi:MULTISPECIES: phosphoglucomutase/phosphomannomutase PgmG [unclassified Sphingomonas]|uniref:phosphoglucomutase/phosphomannomutase PgmG n=1 Tax=unclassified Sphingomonas TaxID=196159 RepID=UPI00286B5097|nr:MULTISPECIES: phosphomannomutase/phosphoglucomutase [unclassified Sphingomonas]